jgi:hypothetical protein
MRESWRLEHWKDPDEARLHCLTFIHPVTAEFGPGIDMFQASINGFDFLPGDVAGRIPIQPLFLFPRNSKVNARIFCHCMDVIARLNASR